MCRSGLHRPSASGVGEPVRCRRRLSGSGAGGFATAEVAVLLPALTLLAALCVSAVAAAAVHVRCLDAARTGARALARDEPVAVAVAATRARAPAGSEVTVDHLPGGLVAVEVTATARLLGAFGPGVRVGGDVVAAVEGDP
jgi:hypothetical protein